jgi:hypothetical protein
MEESCQLHVAAALSLDTYYIGNWVGPRASLEATQGRQIFTLPEIELRPSNMQLVGIPTELSRLFHYFLQQHY